MGDCQFINSSIHQFSSEPNAGKTVPSLYHRPASELGLHTRARPSTSHWPGVSSPLDQMLCRLTRRIRPCSCHRSQTICRQTHSRKRTVETVKSALKFGLAAATATHTGLENTIDTSTLMLAGNSNSSSLTASPLAARGQRSVGPHLHPTSSSGRRSSANPHLHLALAHRSQDGDVLHGLAHQHSARLSCPAAGGGRVRLR
jgi:hypothetical protein